MTVGLAVRIPGHGAVLACDGRITVESTGQILSDTEKKFAICGSIAVLVAGNLGPQWTLLQAQPPKSYAALRDVIATGDSDVEWMAYDRKTDKLMYADNITNRLVAGVGSGSPFGIGALEAGSQPKTLPEARERIERAIGIAIRWNSSCGGRVRVITVPKRGKIQVH
jgi:ATP-dependent protease HslVU (ClpYQ) peptidase subunit